MSFCPNCRQTNDDNAYFCRGCGHRMTQLQNQTETVSQNNPRPYMWKTDEFQVNQTERNPQITNQFQTVTPPYHQMSLGNAQNPQFVAGYRCPRCGTHNLPYVTRQISTAGWITFAILLVTTFIFFWIGLLLKEDVRICPACGFKFK